MKKILKRVAIVIGCVGVLGAGVFTFFTIKRGPTGATAGYGGTLAAQAVPEFESFDPARWANGAPLRLAEARGQVVLIEVWHPS